MLKKTGLFIIAFATLCFLLTGCVETDINVRIDGANGGDITTTLLIEKSFYDMMAGGEITGLDGMTQGETTVDGTGYVTFSEKKSYETYAELENALHEMTFLDDGESETAGIFKSVEIQKSGGLFENRYTFRAVTNAQASDEEMEMNGMDFGDIYKLRLEIAMPGDIGESTGGEAEGNILKCDITDLARENKITAVSASMNTLAVVITVVVVIVIIAMLFALFGKGGAKGK